MTQHDEGEHETRNWTPKFVSEFRAVLATFDGFDAIFGLFLWFSTFLALVSWASMIVRALRGENVKQGCKEDITAALAIAAWSMASASHFRAAAISTESVAEMRSTVYKMNVAFIERDERATKRDDRIARLTRAMLWIAGVTLAVSIIALVGSLVRH